MKESRLKIVDTTLEDTDQRSEDVIDDVDFNLDVMCDRKQEEKPVKDLTLNENGKMELEMHTARTVAERKDAARLTNSKIPNQFRSPGGGEDDETKKGDAQQVFKCQKIEENV